MTHLAYGVEPAQEPPRATSWNAIGQSSGLWQSHSALTSSLTPMWFDLDGDGHPEPVWWSSLGSVSLHNNGGEPSISELQLPEKLKQIDGLPLVAVPLDVDGNGELEVLVLGRELVLLNYAGDGKFTVAKSSLPTLPGALINDVAVGDLNQDGLPDLVLALGLGTFERVDAAGLPDLVLMNRGHGRFERQRLEPARALYTRGITLVDMDKDGRLDVVESVDMAGLSRPGRVLLNRTEAGALAPTFEVAGTTWDTGAFSLGAAVADLDQDGQMDVYGASVGRDLLMFGTPEGSFTPEAEAGGIHHEWGPEMLRVQWGPSLLDLNGDGRLDILVRHGGRFEIETGGLTALDIQASDLSYLQDSNGHFHRTAVPYDGLARGQGRHAVSGDWNGDGLPEVALGGLDGASDFWINQTQVPATSRTVTVRFRTSVSAWPPTGAVVVGRCGGQSWTRHLTSGGKLAATAAVEVYGAWDACSATPEVEVHWPSGARSIHELDEDLRVLVAQEPQWWNRVETTVTLDPSTAGASKACIGGSGTDWNCCESAAGPCEFQLTNLEDAVIASLDEAAPCSLMAKSHWGMHISPSPPRPGQPAYLNIMHVGDPSTFDPTTTSVWINGESLVLNPDYVDHERQNVQYKVIVEEGAPGLYITLFPLNLLPEVTWTIPTGNSIDSDWLDQSSYPHTIYDGDTESWHVAIFVNMLREPSIEEQIDFPTLKTAAGTPVPMLKQYLKSSVARVRLLVDPALLENVDELRLQDQGSGYGASILVPGAVSLETAVSRLERVDGDLLRGTFRGVGDLSHLFVTLRDADDRVLPPEESLISLELDGAHVSEPVSIFDSTYNLLALLHGDGQPGPGEVRVMGLDGAQLGSFTFDRTAPPEVELDLASTTAALYTATPESSHQGTHRIEIQPRLSHGELAGAAARAELSLEGAQWVSPLALDRYGVLTAWVRADPTASALNATVVLNGEVFNSFSTPLEPTQEPGADTSGGGHGDLTEPDGPAASRDDGCQAGGPGAALAWLPWLACLALGWCRRRHPGVP